MYENYCKIRDLKGLKDADIARMASIPKSTFSEWKSGRSVPKMEKMQKIADVLGVTYSQLIGVDEIKTDEVPLFRPDHLELMAYYEQMLPKERELIIQLMSSIVKNRTQQQTTDKIQ